VAASRSRPDPADFIEMVRRIPKEAFLRAISKMGLTPLESRELYRLFKELR